QIARPGTGGWEPQPGPGQFEEVTGSVGESALHEDGGPFGVPLTERVGELTEERRLARAPLPDDEGVDPGADQADEPVQFLVTAGEQPMVGLGVEQGASTQGHVSHSLQLELLKTRPVRLGPYPAVTAPSLAEPASAAYLARAAVLYRGSLGLQ